MKQKRIAVCGMGYVGLTLAVRLAEQGFEVTGVEKSPDVVRQLQLGNPHFHEVGLREALRRYLGRNLKIRSDMPPDQPDVYIIAVGTPVQGDPKLPILDHVVSATHEIAKHMEGERLVILRSTVPVGTSRNVVLPILRASAPAVRIAFCPERTLEGKALEELRNNPQIIGGLDSESLDRAVELFVQITPTLIQVSSLEAAEIIKMVDNCYRDVSFAFSNQIGLICEHLDLDAWEIIKAANMGYPRNHIAMPGFVGGACLTKDPYILRESSERHGLTPNLIMQAREVNESLPERVVSSAIEQISDVGKCVSSCKVFLSGLAFKGNPETDDIRGSDALIVLELLRRAGAKRLFGHDFVVSDRVLRELGIMPVSLEEGFDGADLAFVLNNHSQYKTVDAEALVKRMDKPGVLQDCWHMFAQSLRGDFSGVIYSSIGLRGKVPVVKVAGVGT